MSWFNPRAQYHTEQNPEIDREIQRVARRLESGMTEDEAIDALDAEGWLREEATHVVKAAAILASPTNV